MRKMLRWAMEHIKPTLARYSEERIPMKPLLIAVGVAVLLLGLVSSSRAQQSERVYPIVELTDEEVALIDVKDGSIDDWLDVVGEPALTALNFVPLGGTSYDPVSMDYRIWLAWHDATNRIYVAMQRSDNEYINKFQRECTDCGLGSIMSLQDSGISIYLDGDNSGGQFFYVSADVEDEEEWLLLDRQQAQWYEAIGETHDTGPHVVLRHHDHGEDWFFYPPYAEGGGTTYGQNPTISVTEFYVTPFDRFVYNSPVESVVSELHSGKTIGFVIIIDDLDTAGRTRHILIGEDWFLDPGALHYSDNFAAGLLLGPGGEIPESAVESITWGRIKAMLEK